MGSPPLVWYAAYGSNLLSERFHAYLTGGPVPGLSIPEVGLTDSTPPRRWRRHRLAHPLVFAGQSTRWQCGVCFVDPARRLDPPPTLGRAWLIDGRQLLGVWAAENRGVSPPGIDWPRLRAQGHVDASSGWYRRLLHLGHQDGCDVVTITCAELPPGNQPSAAYRDVVVEGLAQSWELSADEADRYLDRSLKGVVGDG